MIDIEVRSTKSDYESDYRQMLEDISDYYTDLVLQQGSPVTQKLDVDLDAPSNTLYQRFSFVKSLIESDAFSEAIHKIISNPLRKWTETNIERNVVGIKRLSRKNMRQIASKGNRIAWGDDARCDFNGGLASIPRCIEVEYKKDTIDNQENQFVKFVVKLLRHLPSPGTAAVSRPSL